MFRRKSKLYARTIFVILILLLGIGLVISSLNYSNKKLVNVELTSFRIDISKLKEGGFNTYHWGNIPIGVYRRTQSEIDSLAKTSIYLASFNKSEKQTMLKGLARLVSKAVAKPSSDWIKSVNRSIKPDVFVFIMKSPIRECMVIKTIGQKHTKKGIPISGFKTYFLDPCTQQGFDLAGRIFINNYFHKNLLIPSHRYIDENTIEFYPNDEN